MLFASLENIVHNKLISENWASSEAAVDKGCGGYIRDDDDEGHSETVYVYKFFISYIF